ncbi:MAG: DUF1573 domain-containing protein [Pontiellaceae bacterium]|nr:DUF1573 domain-containing protein [Pontiellaceae bacterium]
MSSFYRFVGIGLCCLAAVSAKALPKLECENAKYDFGAQIAGEAITNQFVLWNRGDEPVEILEIKDCCGVTSTMEPMSIAPGTNVVCTSVFDTKNREGEQEKQILLVTNDKRKPYFDLRMVGTLNKAIEFSPRYVRLQDVLPDSAFLETITATNLLPEAVSLESVEVMVSGMTAEISASNKRSWTIQLKSNAPLAVGQINGTLKMNFSTGTVDVPVVGTVAPILQATPEQIQFSSKSIGEVKRMAMLRSGDGRAFDLLSAELKDAKGTVSFKKLSDGKWQLSFSVQPASLAPGAVVEVKTSLDSQELIRIPLVK